MKHTKFATAAVALLLASLFVSAMPATAHADEDEVPGEVVLMTRFEFVKFKVNNKDEWENHEYSGRNKTLLIMGLSREDDNTIVLTPRVEGYEPLTLVIKPTDFKRRRVRKNGRRIAVFQFKKRIRFTKKGAAKPAASAKAAKPGAKQAPKGTTKKKTAKKKTAKKKK